MYVILRETIYVKIPKTVYESRYVDGGVGIVTCQGNRDFKRVRRKNICRGDW